VPSSLGGVPLTAISARGLKPTAPTPLVGFSIAAGEVSPSINTMTFADGACEGRSRSEEEVMQGHRRRRATQRSPATPISPKGGGGTASISLSLLLHDVTDIASSLLRELDAVALATTVLVFMGRDT